MQLHPRLFQRLPALFLKIKRNLPLERPFLHYSSVLRWPDQCDFACLCQQKNWRTGHPTPDHFEDDRRIAIYYVKFLKVFSLRSPGYFFHLFLDILYWFQKALLFLCRDPVPGKWVCRFSWNLRFSGFLNALGCGFYHDKFFFIRVYKDINVLAAVTFAVLPVRIKELVYGNVQQGDDLVKGIQVWLWGRYAVLCFSSILFYIPDDNIDRLKEWR